LVGIITNYAASAFIKLYSVFTEAAAAAVYAPAPPLLVLTDAAATAVFPLAPLPLVLTDTSAAAVFARAPLPLVLAVPTAAAVFALFPLPLVLTQSRGIAGLLGCRRMWYRSCGQARCIAVINI